MLGKNSSRSDWLTVENSWLMAGVVTEEEEAAEALGAWVTGKLDTAAALGWGPRLRLSMILHAWCVAVAEGEESGLGCTEKPCICWLKEYEGCGFAAPSIGGARERERKEHHVSFTAAP